MQREKPRAKTPVRVLVVDDHDLIREAVRTLLERETPDLRVCAEAENENQMWQAIARGMPDVIVLDLGLKEVDGFQLLASLRARCPRVPVLVLSMSDERLFAAKAFRAGARGYLMKDHCVARIATAIRMVHAGERYASEEVKQSLLAEVAGEPRAPEDAAVQRLSDRQRHVLRLLGQGWGPSRIAARLSRTVKTVEYHCAVMRRELGLSNMAQLRALAATRHRRG